MVSLLTAMFKSDSSTAVLGFFLLPGAAVFGGMLALAAGWIAERMMEHGNKNVRIARWVQYAMLASAVPLGIWLGW